jgi:hypothetical protein
MNGNNSQMGNS